MGKTHSRRAGSDVATFVYIGLACAFGGGLSIVVHANRPQCEVPVIFGSLAVGIAVLGVALKGPRRARAALASGGLSLVILSGGLGILHGWKDAVYIGYGVASLLYVVIVLWVTKRTTRQIRAAIVEEAQGFAEPYMPPPMLLPGQATEIYPSGGKVVRAAVAQMVALAIACGIIWWLVRQQVPAQGWIMVAICGALIVLIVWALSISVLLLVQRRPAVVLMAEGFIDNATLGASGMGYIRWRQVLGMTPIGKRAQRRLLVMVSDPDRVRGRLSRWQRLQLAVLSGSGLGLSPVAIPEWLLPMGVEELQEQMERRIEATTQPAGEVGMEDTTIE